MKADKTTCLLRLSRWRSAAQLPSAAWLENRCLELSSLLAPQVRDPSRQSRPLSWVIGSRLRTDQVKDRRRITVSVKIAAPPTHTRNPCKILSRPRLRPPACMPAGYQSQHAHLQQGGSSGHNQRKRSQPVSEHGAASGWTSAHTTHKNGDQRAMRLASVSQQQVHWQVERAGQAWSRCNPAYAPCR